MKRIGFALLAALLAIGVCAPIVGCNKEEKEREKQIQQDTSQARKDKTGGD